MKKRSSDSIQFQTFLLQTAGSLLGYAVAKRTGKEPTPYVLIGALGGLAVAMTIIN